MTSYPLSDINTDCGLLIANKQIQKTDLLKYRKEHYYCFTSLNIECEARTCTLLA